MSLFEQAYLAIDELGAKLTQIRNVVDEQQKALLQLSKESELSLGNREGLEEFIRKPYILRPMRSTLNQSERWELIIPKFIGFRAGWPVRSEGLYDVFMVSRFIDLLTPLPAWLKSELGMEPLPFRAQIDGNALIVHEGDPRDVWERFGGSKSFSARRDNKLIISERKRMDVLRSLIREGVMPFAINPIDQNDLRESRGKVTLRPHQLTDFNKFLTYGSGSLFATGGAGKTFFSLYAGDRLKGKKIVFAPRLSILDQWRRRVEILLPGQLPDWEFRTYASMLKKPPSGAFTLAIFDEIQTIPSNTGLKAAHINAKYRLGLSATPWREDGQEDLIPALCGVPFGMDWPIERESAQTTLWIVESDFDKVKMLKDILKKPVIGKTLIFVYRLELGERIAKEFKIPFVSGKTRQQYETIEKNDTVVISKVGDAGISVEASRVIEIDFLGGRAEIGQRLLRTNHAANEAEAHLIWSKGDYQRAQNRLTAASALNFNIKVRGAES